MNIGSGWKLSGLLLVVVFIGSTGFYFLEKQNSYLPFIVALVLNLIIIIYYCKSLRKNSLAVDWVLYIGFFLIAISVVAPIVIISAYKIYNIPSYRYIPMDIPPPKNAAEEREAQILQHIDQHLQVLNAPQKSDLTLKETLTKLLSGQLPNIDTFSDGIKVTVVMLFVLLVYGFLLSKIGESVRVILSRWNNK